MVSLNCYLLVNVLPLLLIASVFPIVRATTKAEPTLSSTALRLPRRVDLTNPHDTFLIPAHRQLLFTSATEFARRPWALENDALWSGFRNLTETIISTSFRTPRFFNDPTKLPREFYDAVRDGSYDISDLGGKNFVVGVLAGTCFQEEEGVEMPRRNGSASPIHLPHAASERRDPTAVYGASDVCRTTTRSVPFAEAYFEISGPQKLGDALLPPDLQFYNPKKLIFNDGLIKGCDYKDPDGDVTVAYSLWKRQQELEAGGKCKLAKLFYTERSLCECCADTLSNGWTRKGSPTRFTYFGEPMTSELWSRHTHSFRTLKNGSGVVTGPLRAQKFCAINTATISRGTFIEQIVGNLPKGGSCRSFLYGDGPIVFHNTSFQVQWRDLATSAHAAKIPAARNEICPIAINGGLNQTQAQTLPSLDVDAAAAYHCLDRICRDFIEPKRYLHMLTASIRKHLAHLAHQLLETMEYNFSFCDACFEESGRYPDISLQNLASIYSKLDLVKCGDNVNGRRPVGSDLFIHS